MAEVTLQPHDELETCAVSAITCEESSDELRASLTEVAGLGELFRALADETRVRILHLLSHQELCVCDLAYLLEMSQPAVSHHMRLLKAWRLICSRREGKLVFYTLADRHVVTLIETAREHDREER